MKLKFPKLIVWGLLAFTVSAPGATYEVARLNPQASDSGDGSSGRPWKTIAKAAATAVPGDTVLIRAGIYREQVTIKTNGTPQAPIKERYPEGPVPGVILGAEP